MEGTFAATPPLEAFKYLLSLLMTVRRVSIPFTRKMKRKIMVLDLSRAHFHADSVREMFVKLPKEDETEGCVGRLRKTVYGARDAAAQWESFYSRKFLDASFEQGLFSPCLFAHRERGIEVLATRYRSMCMRIGFIAQDCPHLQFQAKELARRMSQPTRGAFQRWKRVARFLKGHRRPVQEFVMCRSRSAR